MSRLASLIADGFRIAEDQFQAVLADLRRELSAATVLEALLIEQIIPAVGRLRKAAQLEPEGKLDKDWLRYQSAAERSFWKALNALQKGRRPARGRAAEPVAVVAPAEPEPAPVPMAELEPEPIAPAAAKEPEPAPASRPTPTPAPSPTPHRPAAPVIGGRPRSFLGAYAAATFAKAPPSRQTRRAVFASCR